MATQQPTQEQMQDYARHQAQFMARVWSDPQFKQRLIGDPKSVLQEQGVPVPEGMEIRVVENTESVFYLVLPPSPAEQISDEQLEAVAGGSMQTAGSAATTGSLGSLSCPVSTVGSVGTVSTLGSATPIGP